ISGVIATSAITPNASVIGLPPVAALAPSVNERMNVLVIGPLATPPESYAIPTNNFGHHIVSSNATAYPGTTIHHKLNRYSTRSILSAIEIATPADNATSITLRLIVPPLTLSTCSVRIHTAGSAHTTTAPNTKPTAVSSTVQIPPFAEASPPSTSPSLRPAGIKPPFTPTRKITKPTNA